MEVERLYREWDIELDWMPFLLDPTVPPEGRTREPRTKPGDPPTPVEERGESLGLEFRRGNTFQPASRPAFQASEFAREHATIEQEFDFHRRLFRAHFTDHENLMDHDVLVRHAEAAGLDGAELRDALERGRYAEPVEEAIEQARAIGITGVPTFILDGRYAVVGAQPHEVLVDVLERLGAKRRNGADEG